MFRAVIFDLGGVVFPSPFEAFDNYDATAGLERGTVRALIRTSSETGAWAALERGELTMDQFRSALESEAQAAGFTLDGIALLGSFGNGAGARPSMLTAIARIREHGLRVAQVGLGCVELPAQQRQPRVQQPQLQVLAQKEGLLGRDQHGLGLVAEVVDARGFAAAASFTGVQCRQRPRPVLADVAGDAERPRQLQRLVA